MSIRKKAIVIFSGILLGSLTLQYLLANRVLLSSFSELENQEVQEDVLRAANAITDELNTLENTAKDWAYWDDTYQFMQGSNDAYVEDNLSVETMTNIDVNVMAFVDNDATIRYAKVIDLDEGLDLPIPATFQNQIPSLSLLLDHSDLHASVKGLIEVDPKTFMLFALVEVLDNSAAGPAQGTLIIGRYLNESRIAALTDSTRLDFTVHAVGSTDDASSGVTVFTSPFDVTTLTVKPLSDKLNAGLVGFSDVFGQPALVLELKSPRHIYQHGQQTFLILLGVVVIIATASFAGAMFLLEKVVLTRLSVLSEDVSRIPESDDVDIRVSGNDEIASLATIINSMLNVLRNSKRELYLSNQNLEAKVAERTQQLEQSIGHTEAILRSSSDALITTNDDGKITQINPAFSEMFGYTMLQAERLQVWKVVTADSVALLRQGIDATVQDHKPRRVEVTALRADQTTFNAEMALSALVDGNGHVFGGVASIRDISQHKLIEDNLREALAKERELRELKTRFISMASHEFRTPLAIIQASSDLLQYFQQHLADDQKKEHFEKIGSQIKHMTELLDQVLMMNRNDLGNIEFSPVETNLDTLCRDIVDEIKLASNVTHRQKYTCNGQCTPILVDPKLIRHAITNLLWNGIKYSPKGSTIDLQLTFEEKQVVIKVSDQGIGIPEKDHKYLFQPFHRAENVGTTPGTGLGLAITKQAVDMHKGSITYESQENVGTTFTITLPHTPHKDYTK